MHKKTALLMGLLLAAASLAACGGSNKDTQAAAIAEMSVRETITEADPEGAAAAIYETLEGRDTQQLDEEGLFNYMDIDPDNTLSFVAFYSEAKSGLSDLVFIDPVEDMRDQVREALYAYKNRRIEEFRNYDILDAFSIAENAVVYDQGDYLVLLMVPDTEAARDIVDSYIPQ